VGGGDQCRRDPTHPRRVQINVVVVAELSVWERPLPHNPPSCVCVCVWLLHMARANFHLCSLPRRGVEWGACGPQVGVRSLDLRPPPSHARVWLAPPHGIEGLVTRQWWRCCSVRAHTHTHTHTPSANRALLVILSHTCLPVECAAEGHVGYEAHSHTASWHDTCVAVLLDLAVFRRCAWLYGGREGEGGGCEWFS
jgi:hypothetical protein